MAENRVLSGVITISSAGTAQQGNNVAAWRAAQDGGGFFIRGAAGNTGVVYVGNDGAGDVASTNGYELSAGDQIFVICNNLNELWFDAANSSDKIHWLKA